MSQQLVGLLISFYSHDDIEKPITIVSYFGGEHPKACG